MLLEYSLFFGSVGLIMSVFVPSALTVESAFLRTLETYVALIAIFTAIVVFSSPEPVMPRLTAAVDEMLKTNQEFYKSSGMLTDAQLQTLSARMKDVSAVAIKLLPALAVLLSSLLVFVNLVFIKGRMIVLGAWTATTDLTLWSASEYLVWPVIGMGLLVALGRPAWLAAVGLNLLIIFLVPFLFHGLSIVAFYLKKFNVARWLRWLIYLFSFFQLWAAGFVLLGLFDQWVDFRRLKKIKPATRNQGGPAAES